MLRSPEPAFDYQRLLAELGPARTRFDLEHIDECPSTNTELLARAAKGAPSGSALVCERQTAGRGRRGRQWHSSPGCSLCFSLLWRLPPGTSSAGLSLAAGLALAQALEALGIKDLALKWPNDILLNSRKLGGLLIETAGNPHSLVIGTGLNLHTDPAWQANIDQAFASLDEAGMNLAHETLLASILRAYCAMLDEFSQHGFAVFREAWQARHALTGQAVHISSETREIEGICANVRNDGSLEILTPEGLHLLHGGEISLRPNSAQKGHSCTC